MSSLGLALCIDIILGVVSKWVVLRERREEKIENIGKLHGEDSQVAWGGQSGGGSTGGRPRLGMQGAGRGWGPVRSRARARPQTPVM